MYTQILMLLLCLRTNTYLSPQLLVYLPLNVPDHDPAISFSYFKYSIWLTAKIYPSTLYCSTCSQIYPFMSIPVQYFSLFCITYTVKFPLICWVRTHRSNRKYTYMFIFILPLCLTTKTYLSPKILVYLPIDVPFHDPTCSFSYFVLD